MRFVSTRTLSFIVFFVALSIGQYADAQMTIPAGCRLAGASDLEEMKAAGIPSPTVGQIWCPDDKYTGASTGEAKQYLRSILCAPDGDNYGGMGPDGTIQGLDAKFSVCAAKFLKAARDGGINVCIREGVRSVAKQNSYVQRGVIACKKGAACEHPRGVALDVNVLPNRNACESYRRLHSSASQFGITFYLGCKDAYHMVPVSGGNCSSGGSIPNEEYYDFPQYYTSQTPSDSFSDRVRQALGIQPAPLPPLPPTQQLPQQPAQQQQVQSAFQTSASSPVGTPQVTPTPISEVLSPTNISNQLNMNQPSATSGTSTLDLLNAFLNPFSATSTEIGTSTPITLLYGTMTDVASVANSSTSTNGSLNASGTIVSMQPINAQQTFTSVDLQYVGAQTGTQTTLTWKVLENMKQVLLRALEYLKPFGGVQFKA